MLVRPKDDRCRHSLSLMHAIRQRQHGYDDTRKQQETCMTGVRIKRSHVCTKGCTRQGYTRQGMRASGVGVRAVMRAPRGHAHRRGTRVQGRCARQRAHTVCALWVAAFASGCAFHVLGLSTLPELRFGQGEYIFRSRIMAI